MKKSKKQMKERDGTLKPNSVSAWVLATRPKTLAAACSPVVVGLGLAYRDVVDGRVESDVFVLLPAICCLAFAILAQIAANFVNDYADFKKGADTSSRQGPRRAVASGLISPRAMLAGAFVALAIACLFGLATLLYVVPERRLTLIGVGLVCCVFCLLYSAGPFPLAYIGLGDVLVVVFFGIVAVCFTYFVQTQTLTLDAALLGTAIGFATDNILVSNNYRDRDEDRAAKKHTLVAIFGERFGRYFYLVNGLVVVALIVALYELRDWRNPVVVGALIVYFVLHLQAWRTLSRIRSGSGLVQVLALSSRNLLILSVMLSSALVF